MLEVIHDERRLRGAVDVKLCRPTRDRDLHFRPGTGLDVGVRLVHAGMRLPQLVPRVFRMRDVLRRVIATELIVGAAIRGPEIEALVSRTVSLYMERNADEAARIGRGVCAWRAGKVDLDRAVRELPALQQ